MRPTRNTTTTCVRLLLTVLLLGGLVGCGSYKKNMKEGDKAMADGRYTDAVRYYEMAAAEKENDLRSGSTVDIFDELMERGRIKDRDKALAKAREARNASRTAPDRKTEERLAAVLADAKKALAASRLEEANRKIDEAARLASTDAGRAEVSRLAAELERRRTSERTATLRAMVEQIRAQIAAGDTDSATRSVRELEKLEPDNPDVAALRRAIEDRISWNGLVAQVRQKLEAEHYSEAASLLTKASGAPGCPRPAPVLDTLAADIKAGQARDATRLADYRGKLAAVAETMKRRPDATDAPAVSIESVSVESDVRSGDRRGAELRVIANVSGASGLRPVQITARFFDKTAKPLPGKLFFSDEENHLISRSTVAPEGDKPTTTVREEVRLFLPYDAVPAGAEIGYIVGGRSDGHWVSVRTAVGVVRSP